jgi:hypothetical protein
MRPSPRYNSARLDPQFQRISFPVRNVEVERYLDGGSVGIVITDSKGDRILCEISSGEQGSGVKRVVYVGTLSGKVAEAIQAEHVCDNLHFLLRVIEENGSPSHDRTVALLELRGYARDYMRAWLLWFEK